VEVNNVDPFYLESVGRIDKGSYNCTPLSVKNEKCYFINT